MNTIVEDVLIYLPEWTIKPPSKPHKEYAKAFLENDSNELTSEINVRKHISSEEILKTYHMTKITVSNYLCREQVPNVNTCYVATCMWTAGVLEEKYKFKSTTRSQLILDAQKMLTPYIKHYFKVLNGHHHHHHCKPTFNNEIHLTVYEE